METFDPILGNPLFVAALLLFLIILPLALRQSKKSELDKIIDRMEQEDFKEAAKEEAVAIKEAAKQDSAPIPPDPLIEGSVEPVDEEPKEPAESPPVIKKKKVDEKPKEPADSPPVIKKKKKVVKEGIPISHNEAATDLSKSPLGSAQPDKGQKSSWDEDFKNASPSDSEDHNFGDNWVEAEIPGLIIEPFPMEESSKAKPKPKSKESSETKPKSLTEAPADKGSEEVPTFKATPQQASGFGVDEFEDFPSRKNPVLDVKKPVAETVEKKETPDKETAESEPEIPELEMEIPESESKDVENKTIVVSHRDIAEKEGGKKERPSSSPRDGKLPFREETPLRETAAEMESIPPRGEDREPAPDSPKPKPFFLDLKYMVEEELAAGTGSPKKLSAGMVDRIVARLNDLQTRLERQLASLPRNPATSGMRNDRLQDPPPVVEDKREVSLEELDSFLFTAHQRKK